MTIKNADKILTELEGIAMYTDYDIDADANYREACRIVTEADWYSRDIKGFELDEFNRLVKAVNEAMEEV